LKSGGGGGSGGQRGGPWGGEKMQLHCDEVWGLVGKQTAAGKRPKKLGEKSAGPQNWGTKESGEQKMTKRPGSGF